MTLLSKTALLGAIGMAAVMLPAASASAAIACRGTVCWHVHGHYDYPRRARVVIHEDTWHPRAHVVFREHEGRGYWHGGSWVAW